MNKQERRIYNREWRKQNLEKVRIYDREWKRQYKIKNPDKVKKKRRERYYREMKNSVWHEKRKAYMRDYSKKWRKNNPSYAEQHRKYANKRQNRAGKEIYQQRRKRPYEKMASVIRSRIISALKYGYKSAHTEELIGITFPKLKVYLEKQFKPGMTWENHSFYGWHIDHRLPLSSFDLTNPEEQKKAFHYTNLQPLWMKENLQKGNKIS
jgi:hypothetical protein